MWLIRIKKRVLIAAANDPFFRDVFDQSNLSKRRPLEKTLPRAKYSPEFRVKVVKAILSGKSIPQAAKEFGISYESAWKWRKNYLENPNSRLFK